MAQPQEPSPPPANEKQQEKKKDKETDPDEGWPRTPETMEQEIQYRAALELRESERRKAVEAAEEIINLARRLKTSVGGGERINVSGTLESIEKLAKRIRSSNGGGGSDQGSESEPATLETGADQIMGLAQELKQHLESLDSRVISVNVIDSANAIIQLSNYLRERARSGRL
jgi:hypothetical protein